jgi:hypothetical protein
LPTTRRLRGTEGNDFNLEGKAGVKVSAAQAPIHGADLAELAVLFAAENARIRTRRALHSGS